MKTSELNVRRDPYVEFQPEHLQRRRFLMCTGALAAALGVAIPPQRANAQAIRDARLRTEIGLRARQAENLLNRVVDEGAERPNEAIKVFQEQQQQISAGLSQIFNQQMKQDDWSDFVQSDQAELANNLRRNDVRLVPTSQEVENSIKEPTPAPTQPQGATESLINVIIDIALDAMGLRELSEKLSSLLRSNASVAVILQKIAVAIRAKRFGEAAYFLGRFLRGLLSGPVLAEVEKVLGKGAVIQLGRAVAVRFVPFIGWGYLTACLLAAIYRNLPRLANARFP